MLDRALPAIREREDGSFLRGECSFIYKGHSLYSKYAPKKVPLAIADALNIERGTLIVVCSPLLCYGMKEIINKLKEDCFIAAVERDEYLYKTASSNFPKDNRCVLLDRGGVERFIKVLCGEGDEKERHLIKPFSIRRAVRVDLSGGAGLNSGFYCEVFRAVEKAIARAWKNRATLIKFGRLYSRNLLRNIARFPRAITLESLSHTVKKPIVVFGAGESMERSAREVKRRREEFYCIAVDAAFFALAKMGVVADAIVSEEGQSIIESAFIGFNSCLCAEGNRRSVHAFLSVTGWTGAFDAVSGAEGVTYYAPRYCACRFLDRLKDKGVLKELLPPVGSVGLTAVKIALAIRGEGVAVFTAGLDFSYSIGATHVRGSAPVNKRLSVSNRLNPPEAYSVSFNEGVIKAGDKRTMPNMALYAALFREQFEGVKLLFDCGDAKKCGMELGIEKGNIKEAIKGKEGVKDFMQEANREGSIDKDNVLRFYESEKAALKEIKKEIDFIESEGGGDCKKVIKMLQDREYLYLHFPDYIEIQEGECKIDMHFLSRVRAEIGFFIKDIDIGIAGLLRTS